MDKMQEDNSIDIEKEAAEPSPQVSGERKHKRSRMFLSSNVPQYFRELSIVIIGVLVTLLITNAISNYTRQKEIKGILKFVKTELAENLENLRCVQMRWEEEQYIYRLLQQNLDNIRRIPADTLDKYRYTLGTLHDLTIKNDSYELLKTSMLIQYVKDKDLLRRLSKTYGAFQSLNLQLTTYNTQKKNIFTDPVMSELDEEGMKDWIDGNAYDFFDYLSHKREFLKFVFIGKSIISPPSAFTDCGNDVQETIQFLDQEGF